MLLLAIVTLGTSANIKFTRADDVQRIAAIVNDEVISRYDVAQRVQLVIYTSGLDDTKKVRSRLHRKLLRVLVDERLQLQEAKRNLIRVGKNEMASAYKFIEQQNRIPPGGLIKFLQANQIPKAVLEEQILAQISWSKLINKRLGPKVNVSEGEVDAVLTKLRANVGRFQVRISEIFLPIESPENKNNVRINSIELVRQLRAGASFNALAREFSQGATAAQGGAIGWVQPGQLAKVMDQAIQALKSGQLSDPIFAQGGYYIFLLHKRRKIPALGVQGMKLDLQQVLLPIGKGSDKDMVAAHKKSMKAISKKYRGCSKIDASIKTLEGASTNNLGSVLLANLPNRIAIAIKDLPIGIFSKPLLNNNSFMLLMVCKRENIAGQGPSRATILKGLTSRRIATLAQRYLRDIRRSAVVELR